AGPRALHDLLGMTVRRSGEHDAVHFGILEQLSETAEQTQTVLAREILILLRARARGCSHETDRRAVAHGIDQRAAPPTQSNDCDSQRRHGPCTSRIPV